MDKNIAARQADINTAVTCGTYYALYMFVFLLSELICQSKGAIAIGVEKVVSVYTVGLIFTAVGYLLLPFSRALIHGERARGFILLAAGAMALLSFGAIIFNGPPFFFMLLVAIYMTAVGYIGAFVHYAMAMEMRSSPYGGITIGCAICSSIIIQYIVQNFTTTDFSLFAAITAAFAVMFLILRGREAKLASCAMADSKMCRTLSCVKECRVLIAITAIMSIVMGISDGILTSLHASGEVVLSAYPRLFYAVSLVMAGYIADIKKRFYMPVATTCVLLLSVVITSFFEGSYGYVISLSTLYFLGGFAVVYFTTAFMDIAPDTDNPALWAGMGRIVRSLTIGFIAIPGTMLFRCASHHLLTLISLTLSLAVLVIFYINGKIDCSRAKVPSEKLDNASFAERFGLTERESELAKTIIMSSENIKELAVQMSISERALQRSIKVIYDKTGAESRLALIRIYYENKGDSKE